MNADAVTIPDGYLKTVCRQGQGATTCAYITFGEDFCCAKGTPIEKIIKNRLAEGTISAQGDNCSGPPEFTPKDITVEE